jgi:nucleoside-diphosphate-sugar epimerase
MRLLLTGATGYVGSHLVARAHRQGWKVDALVRPNSDLTRIKGHADCWLYDGALNSVSACCTAVRPDVAIHLAANQSTASGPDVIQPLFAANILFGVHLLEALAQVGCTSFVNAGTFSEYNEDSKYAPRSLYAATKRAFRDLTNFYSESHGFKIRTLVLYDIYGPNDWRPKLLPALVDALVTGSPIDTTPGWQELDLVHVDDACAALLLSAAELVDQVVPQHEVYSVRSGRLVTLRDIVRTLEQAAGRNLNVNWGALPYRALQIFRAPQLIPVSPGWSSSVGLEEGLRGMLAARLAQIAGSYSA